jgi:hypothetical protein
MQSNGLKGLINKLSKILEYWVKNACVGIVRQSLDMATANGVSKSHRPETFFYLGREIGAVNYCKIGYFFPERTVNVTVRSGGVFFSAYESTVKVNDISESNVKV